MDSKRCRFCVTLSSWIILIIAGCCWDNWQLVWGQELSNHVLLLLGLNSTISLRANSIRLPPLCWAWDNGTFSSHSCTLESLTLKMYTDTYKFPRNHWDLKNNSMSLKVLISMLPLTHDQSPCKDTGINENWWGDQEIRFSLLTEKHRYNIKCGSAHITPFHNVKG